MPNRLANEPSAYLRSAAHQPVDWMPWGRGAFERARREGKPVLLDIGAVWCHWCHVIDRESYEDARTAEIINREFVPVKVDRDERPDVDARYQEAVQAIAGQGGWPLTAFLTPEGRVFFGGTYFPPEDAHGRPAFRTILARVAEAWRAGREDILRGSERLHGELARPAGRPDAAPLSHALVDSAVESIAGAVDVVHGGFGHAPKFPHAPAIDLALARYAATGDATLRMVAEETLTGMALGGIHDQIGGGFHRYSVDAEWIVPHFEKMLYDNAALLGAYARAALVFDKAVYREAALGIVRFLCGTLEDRKGGFHGSQDADVGLDDDGGYWTWTVAEVEEAIADPVTRRAVLRHYDVEAQGEMHHDPAKNVLYVRRPVDRVAKELGLAPPEAERRLAQGRTLLLAARSKRPSPIVDPAVYVSWSAEAASGLLAAYRALGGEGALDAAARALDRILKEGWDPDVGMAHVLAKDGARVRGLLDDHVFTGAALIDAYEVAGGEARLEAAQGILRFTLERFADPTDGVLHDVAAGLHDADGIAPLETPRTPLEDAPTPAGNAVAALALDRLAILAGDATFRDAAGRILAGLAGRAERMGIFAATYFLAVDRHLHAATEVAIVGEGPRADALHAAALRGTDPYLVVHPPGGKHLPAAAREATASGIARKGPVALVCRGSACSAPVREPRELARLLARPS